MDDQAEALLLRTVTVERFIGTFDQPNDLSVERALTAPRKYSETREISIRYEPVDRYRGVSRVLLRTSVRQWLDRMLALPSQVSCLFWLVVLGKMANICLCWQLRSLWASFQHVFLHMYNLF